MAQWKKALELAPTNPVAWNNLGKAYGKQGRITEAFRHFARAGELAPREALYHRNLATLIFSYPDEAARHYLIDRSQVVQVTRAFQKSPCARSEKLHSRHRRRHGATGHTTLPG
ncbi:MAG: hypothetical protein Ct9H300mP32_2780 [Verrucomicrobiota bacterium]|nr:MAG: hypothetical protein Ct9H300mP32_2780 [Verrucomicrobiota bacterium]